MFNVDPEIRTVLYANTSSEEDPKDYSLQTILLKNPFCQKS